MLKKHLFVGLIFFILSCDEKKEIKTKPVFSKNQEIILKIYKTTNKDSKYNLDNFTPIKIETLAKNETADFKAIAQILCASYYAKDAKYEMAKKHYLTAFSILKNSKTDTLKARVLNGLGNYNKNTGNFETALKFYYKALKINDQEKNTNGIASTFSNIGDLHQMKGDLKQAKENLNKALNLLKDNKNSQSYLITSHTLANVYGMSGDFKSALAIDEKSLKICNKINSDRLKVRFIDNKANCFMYDNRLDSAQIYFDKCLELDLKIKNKKQIADTYCNQGYLAMLQQNFQKAETLTLKSIEMLNELNQKPNIINSYDNLVTIYTKQNKFEQALKAKNDFHKAYKFMINEKKEAAAEEFKLVYETEKKEKQLALNRVLLLENEAKSKQQNSIIISISLLTVLIGFVGFLYSKQQKLKNKQQSQEFDLKSAIERIESQNKLQEQRLSISRDLHDNIGSQLTFIISSVDNVKYGFDIDNPKLNNKLTHISSFAKDTILELRDTIWAMNSNAVSFEDLEMRINNFIEKAKISQENISFSFAIDDQLKTQKLTSIQGMNLYRTIQEAVNNALKYAEANVISINAKKVDNQTKITISDNGKGFDTAVVERGNGLNNMQKRVEEIGGKFNLTSSENGTKITVII